MRPRCYAPDLDLAQPFALSREESHHLLRVLRLQVGDAVEAFDGRGSVYHAVVVDATRDRATIRIAEALPPVAVPPLAITVVQAVLKGDSMDAAVRDATMMGAFAIQPVLSEHVVVKAAQVRRAESRERWARVALAAVKQSRRSTLPTIAAVQTLDAWLAGGPQDRRLLFVEPSADVNAHSLRSLATEAALLSMSVVLGPEGGWAQREISGALNAGCVPVSLGPLTLRAESMPVAALAAVWAVWTE